MLSEQGWLAGARRIPSPHYDYRPNDEAPTLLVVHNISLPPGEFGGPWTGALLTGIIDSQVHLFFAEIARLHVSTHCLIRRDNGIVQYVPFNKRTWHAEVLQYQGRERCSDLPIGIESEGTDTLACTDVQYQQLVVVTRALIDYYPDIVRNMVSHCGIASGRRTDPGLTFGWARFRILVSKEIT